MGRAKRIEVVDGEPMVVRAVRTALQSDVAPGDRRDRRLCRGGDPYPVRH